MYLNEPLHVAPVRCTVFLTVPFLSVINVLNYIKASD